jgi:hypothetical protein
LATAQNGYFKISLNPVQNTGTPTATTMGNIGVFINGVALFDDRDGVSWRAATNALAGGPLGGMGDMVWNRDAIVAERAGFDCAKGHPAMGNYHHHQNPSAFNLDMQEISNVCDLYLADGLYVLDSTAHSPLIGFAYDGFPIYGAFGFKNADGTGGITRMKSGYALRNITTRTTYANGTDVSDGPAVNATYPLGFFREDYEYIAPSAGNDDVLDTHNGRFCITPEYPQGTYAYFTTVDENWNSAFPYVVGLTFYGTKTASKVQNIAEAVTTFEPVVMGVKQNITADKVTIYPNPASEVMGIQLPTGTQQTWAVALFDMAGKQVFETKIQPGATIGYFDVSTLYDGAYTVVLNSGTQTLTKTVVVAH